VNESLEDVVNRLVKKVQDHMEWDLEKTLLWFGTANPLLGNATPDDLILKGREKKLEMFIDNCINENWP